MEHGRWWVTDEGRRVLKGQAQIELRKDMAVPAASSTRRERQAGLATRIASDVDASLLEALKALRTRLALAQKVPAYVVFSDRTLVELATRRPSSLRTLREIHGVGDAKLDRYGAAFLDVIRERS
jgi:ATP-dependent DNA helicase RecQ